ncbi:hypothetical protein JVU11DRAFT_6920 [Chiua virens]|nr:hypothetical protein JVU11DRAFT_6920 [Chiua virens]
MDPETDFYQISGYRAHSNGWFKKYDEKPMMDAIVTMKSKLFRPRGPDSPIELVLGILPSGASYLLMSSEQVLEFTLRHRLPPRNDRGSWRSSDFVSLSPIHFTSSEELAAKISTYKQRPRNNNRRESASEPLDNSQANRGYVRTAGSDIVHYRAYFEHQRTLCRLLTRDLQPGKVGLLTPPWLGGIRIVSLVFEEWSVDVRPRDQRLKGPELIHAGWTDAHLPSFLTQPTGSESVASIHLSLKSTKGNLRNPGSKRPVFSAVEDGVILPVEELYERLRKLFNDDANTKGVPLIVVVHDEAMARGVLGRAGIDIDTWTSGLSKLLPRAPRRNRHHAEEPFDPTVLPKPTIVDTQKLVNAVMETSPGNTVPHSAKVLHMQTDTRTCAGDDSLLQLHLWMSMAQGLAIDEQHKQRLAHQPECAQLLAPPQQPSNANADEDEDGDPNDFNPNDAPRGPGPRPTAADDFSDGDDDWDE